MCGIMGYTGRRDACPIVIEGLSRLEYRGYDSAGIAVLSPDGRLSLVKDAGKLATLQEAIAADPPAGNTGIGHTRWATHGKATRVNAHPHADGNGDVFVIHNGIVENHRELRRDLEARGCVFVSETDTEVIPHLIAANIAEGDGLVEATRKAAQRIEGAAAILAIRRQEPGVIVAARIANAGGVVVGYGEDEMFVASDLPALMAHTRRVVFLDDGDMAVVTSDGAAFSRLDGTPLQRQPLTLDLGEFVAGKGVYEHYMAKEIAEQPECVLDTLGGALAFEPPAVNLPDLNLDDAALAALDRMVLLGMGTSLHSAMIGRAYFERLAGLPAEVDNASEYRYRNPVIDQRTLVVAVAQSGETVDTLAAMHEAKRRGALLVAVCNTPGSQATRLAHGTVFMRCGPEVAVASTKTFLGSMTALYLLACRVGQARGFLQGNQLTDALDALAQMPGLIGAALKCEDAVRAAAQRLQDSEHFLFLGRGLQYPIAMEGALKLKEVSYIHAEGYAAGEMKHGPIALIDASMPVVAIAPPDSHYGKMVNNIEEVRARDGRVLAIAAEDDALIAEKAQDVIRVPRAPELLQPLVTAVPLQLLAYHIACLRGRDVDQPRNLAKTVTVE